MACVQLPTPPIIQVPAPFVLPVPDIVPVIPGFAFCCKIPISIPDIPPIVLPPFIVNPAFVVALNAFLKTWLTYLDSLPFPCPLD